MYPVANIKRFESINSITEKFKEVHRIDVLLAGFQDFMISLK